MNSMKDNIKIVDGDRLTIFRAKALTLFTKIKFAVHTMMWRIAVILSWFRF